jgi:hypothetical protein
MCRLEKTDVIYVKSEMNGVEYLVRDLPDKQEAADKLGEIQMTINKFVDYVYNKRNDKEYENYKHGIEQLNSRIKEHIVRINSNSNYIFYC